MFCAYAPPQGVRSFFACDFSPELLCLHQNSKIVGKPRSPTANFCPACSATPLDLFPNLFMPPIMAKTRLDVKC